MRATSGEIDDDVGLDAFRRGDRDALEHCYRRYYRVVERAIGNMVGSADRETVVHEVFFRLLTEQQMRLSYNGPSMGAWLASIGRNRALDTLRRTSREFLVPAPATVSPAPVDLGADDDHLTRLLFDRFRREHLTPEWDAVFQARFVCQMSQREAARHLGIRRTTLAYRELQLRRKLDAFLLEN